MGDIRWGMVGTGDVSHMIAPDFALADGASLAAVCSRSRDRSEAFGAEHSVERTYHSLTDLLDDETIDAVYIATPHATHHEFALQALRAGKHVLIEKPMALNGAEVRDIFEHASRSGLLGMEAMWMKFNPAIAQLRALVIGGQVGEPRSVRASFGLPFPSETGSRWSAEMGGSALLDQGIYPITLAHMIFGAPVSIVASGVTREDGVDLTEHMTLEYVGGRFAQLASSMVEYIEPTASINGTAGWIQVGAPFWSATALEVHSGSIADALFRPTRHEFSREGRGFVPMIRAASEAVRGGSPYSHSPAEVLGVFDTIDTIRAQLRPANRLLQ
jgi:predicted dehydrogenase